MSKSPLELTLDHFDEDSSIGIAVREAIKDGELDSTFILLCISDIAKARRDFTEDEYSDTDYGHDYTVLHNLYCEIR